MRFPIGAMTVGDILDRALKLFFAKLGPFFTINLIMLSPILVIQLATPLVVNMGQGGSVAGPGALPVLLGIGLVLLLLQIVLSLVGSAAILRVIAEEFADRRASVAEALSFAWGRAGSLFIASLMAGLVIMLGFLLCIVPGILFSLWYALVSQVVVVEGLSGSDAMSRSKELTEGFRMRLFGLLLLVGVLQFVLSMGAGMLQLILPYQPQMRPDATFNLSNYYINILVQYLLNIVTSTFAAICITLFYFDLRIRKEGFDLELMAKPQAGPVDELA